MKEPYRKGIANHAGPESYAGDREVAGVARTGVDAGQPLSSEINAAACRPSQHTGKAT